MTLQELVLYLTKKNNITINFHDISGVHSIDRLKLDVNFKMHTNTFCDVAKSTSIGYRLCTACKTLACKKAIKTSEHFFGHCPYGLFELVYPIIFQEKLVSILFVGNFISEKTTTLENLKRACNVTGVDANSLISQLKNTEKSDISYMLQTAEIIENFILSVLKSERIPLRTISGQHWAIFEIKLYIDTHFRQKITLKELAKLYFLNEKYAGRLFLRQVGCTFHSYLTNLRLSAAEELLKNTKRNVIDIAMECGFNSISYFNRSFYEKHGTTPTLYRKSK